MNVLSVVGARPQFVKSFVVSRELRTHHQEVLVHTGQHYDEELSDVFFDELGIPEPDHNLGVGSGNHGEQTARMMTELETLVNEYRPDVVLCYGDTNSTLAAAIVTAKLNADLVHVEAGLRSFNREMPEEINRVLTDHASDLLFAPSERAVVNLEDEGITDGVFFTGDVMYDALLAVRDEAVHRASVLDDLGLHDEEFVLTTVHRPRNTDEEERLRTILETLATDDRRVVFPVHPRTRDRLATYGLWDSMADQIDLVDPVGYVDFVALLDTAAVVATDSGGIQKEAMFLETPCITFREETEWDETVEAGWNVLVGADRTAIETALDSPPKGDPECQPYGDGSAANQIREVLEGTYKSSP
jgi:UDP-N-acetylglucosamine 2-epimerase (non-hydrolysing)